ncbi:MAG: pirin family protein [Rikenellaceae bacterium]|nr:pirin family protein [Rikenellaceae bacterium]
MAGIDFAVHITPELAAGLSDTAQSGTKVVHRARTRGHLNEGWLESYHTFNYGSFSDPGRTNFGMLRVLNEDRLAPGMGFPPHLGENMEIVTIPLEGALEHHDGLGNNTVIRKGDVQIMGTGTGMQYKEYNAHRNRLAKFLQVWVYPARRNAQPRYTHARVDAAQMRNNLALAVSPQGGGAPVWIGQDAWFSMGCLSRDYEFRYRLHSRRNGVYVYLIRGEAEVGGERLRSHDGIGLWDTRCIDIRSLSESEILLIEVPMT